MFLLKRHLSLYLKLKSCYVMNLELSIASLVAAVYLQLLYEYCLTTTITEEGGGGYFTTEGQSVGMSWYRAPLWDLRPDISSCWNVCLKFVVLYLWGALYLVYVTLVGSLENAILCCMLFIVVFVGYQCSQHVGGFHGRLPHHVLLCITKMYWLLRHKSKLSPSNNLLIYKIIFKPIWT
jgi:hypothetical protein